MLDVSPIAQKNNVEEVIGRVIFILMIVAFNIGEVFGLPMAFTLSAATLLSCVCFFKKWMLLQCGIVFFILSTGHFITWYPIFSRVPVLWLLAVIVLSFLIVCPFQVSRNWSAWAKIGKIDASAIAVVVGIGFISSILLIIWANLSDNMGVAVNMAEGVRQYPKPLTMVLLIPLFASLNALTEEIVFRGVLQHALGVLFRNPHLIVALQASAFAALHFALGFPNGWVGYGMTFFYGSALGYLTRWTKGLFAPWLCHLACDLTIFYYVVTIV